LEKSFSGLYGHVLLFLLLLLGGPRLPPRSGLQPPGTARAGWGTKRLFFHNNTKKRVQKPMICFHLAETGCRHTIKQDILQPLYNTPFEIFAYLPDLRRAQWASSKSITTTNTDAPVTSLQATWACLPHGCSSA